MSVEIYATLGEPHEIAATLSDLRYLVFQGLKGDTGDSAYEEAVSLGFVGTEAEWIASLKGEKGDSGAVFLELKTVSNRQVITYNGEQITGAEIDAMYLNGALPVVEYSGRIFVPNKNCYNSGSPSARNTSFMFSRPVSAIETTFISVRYDSSVVNIINQMVYPYFDSGDDEGKVLTVGDDDTLHWETPQGGSAENAVLYTPQSLSDSQKTQARTNVGAGTYSKPSTGIPKSDLASAVQTSIGKADSAYQKPSGGIPASDLASAVQTSLGKADTALQSHQSLAGYATEAWVENKGYLTQHQSLAAYQTKAITDTGGYYTTDTVDGALQEIGAELAGINTLIGSGVIT